MTTSKAFVKYIRIPPRKARFAADLIRGKSIERALSELDYCQMKAGPYLKKLINSAVANAEVQFDARRDLLHVLEVRVDEGPRLKRSKSKARGGRVAIIKRTSHFTVVVGEKKGKEV